jgi:hypothetical protein
MWYYLDIRKSAKYTQNNPSVLLACFIDLRKAFDKVRHHGLLYKLRKNGMSDLFYNIIKNILNTSIKFHTPFFTVLRYFIQTVL